MNASQIVAAYHDRYLRAAHVAELAAINGGMMRRAFERMAAENRFIAACFATVQPQAGLGQP